MLRLKEALINQGRDYPDEIINEILDDFRDEQIKAIVNGLDITDADRWIALENLVGTELEQAEALDIINKFWQYAIATLDFEVGDK